MKWRNSGKGELALRTLYIVIPALFLFLAYFIHIKKIDTVWQLGDEAGYLWPCAHLCGLNWDSIASDSSYFGFGYGIILFPIFFTTHTGVELIRAACLLNVLCVVGCYFCLVKIMSLFSGMRNLFIPCFAFVTCGMPFYSSFVYKVKPECELALLYCLSVLLLYYALKEENKGCFAALGIVIAYMFFVHTRTIAVSIAILLIFGVLMIKKQLNIRSILSFIGPYALIIIMGSAFKKYLLDYKYSLVQSTKLVNASVDSEYICERLQWLLSDGIHSITKYCACFFSKILYSLYATCFLIAVLAFILLCYMRRNGLFENEFSSKTKIMMISITYILLSWIITLAIMTIMGTGGDLRYFMYGRYYEYLFPVIICTGEVYIVRILNNRKYVMILLLSFIGFGIVTSVLVQHYLDDPLLCIDNERLSSLSWLIGRCNSVGEVVNLIICEIVFLFLLIFVAHQRQHANSIILVALALFFAKTSIIDAQVTFEKNKEAAGDTMIAEYVYNEDENIFMVDDDSYRYSHFYSRIQVLLRDKPLNVISEKDLTDVEPSEYVLVYVTSPLNNSLNDEYKEIAKGSSVNLYKKE